MNDERELCADKVGEREKSEWVEMIKNILSYVMKKTPRLNDVLRNLNF